jgi:DNA-binding beta-propeller fold protein YncE
MRRRILPRALGLLVIGLLAVTSMPSAALAAPGDRIWRAAFSGGPRSGAGRAVAVSPDGSRVFVTGEIQGGRTYGTLAYDASTGALLWQARWNIVRRGSAYPSDVAVAPAGDRVFVTGTVSAGSGSDFGTVAYDAATGDLVWSRTYDGPAGGTDSAESLAVAPDGGTVYVAGYSASTPPPEITAATTVAYDSATGAQEWVSRQSPGSFSNDFFSIAVSPDGTRLYATGSRGRFRVNHLMTDALDAATGDVVWSNSYGVPHGESNGYVIGVTPDGGSVLVGGANTVAGHYDMLTIAYDSETGQRRWHRTHDEGGDDVIRDLAVSPAGDTVAITGSVDRHFARDIRTIVYDVHSGATRWARHYDDPARYLDDGYGVAWSPDGRAVYVTGSAENMQGSRYVTIAYEAANGDTRWLHRQADHQSFPFGQANAIAVAPDGSAVYVTGFRYKSQVHADILTIAYEA